MLRQAMLNPLKWKYENVVVSTIAGAGLGIAIGYQSGWLGTLIWALISAVVVGGAVYFLRGVRRQRSAPPLVASHHHGRLKNSTTLALS
jgi:hypothetical protein